MGKLCKMFIFMSEQTHLKKDKKKKNLFNLPDIPWILTPGTMMFQPLFPNESHLCVDFTAGALT